MVAPTPPDPFLAQVPISSLWGCGTAQLVTGWPDPVANWVGSYVLQIIGEKSMLACVMLVAACMYEGLSVLLVIYASIKP